MGIEKRRKIGMMERWNTGYTRKYFGFSHHSIIPLFQYSIIPGHIMIEHS